MQGWDDGDSHQNNLSEEGSQRREARLTDWVRGYDLISLLEVCVVRVHDHTGHVEFMCLRAAGDKAGNPFHRLVSAVDGSREISFIHALICQMPTYTGLSAAACTLTRISPLFNLGTGTSPNLRTLAGSPLAVTRQDFIVTRRLVGLAGTAEVEGDASSVAIVVWFEGVVDGNMS